jgi:hypothetical protein
MPTRVTAQIRAPPHNRGAHIISRGGGDLKVDSLPHDEGDCFGFEPPRIARLRPIISAVEQLGCLCCESRKHTYVLLLVMVG